MSAPSAAPSAAPFAHRPRVPRHAFAALVPLLAAAVSAIASWLVPERAPEIPPGLCVDSWNMEWFPSGYIEPQAPTVEMRRIRAAARAVRRAGVPDVLLVQEIRNPATCRAFAGAIGDPAFRPVVCSGFWNSPTNVSLQQLAIFSRLPCRTNGWERWTARDFVYPPRGYAWAVLETADGPVAFFDVHLKSNFIPEGQDVAQQTVLNRLKRQLAAEQVLAHVARMRAEGVGGEPLAGVVLAGDFNTAAEDPRFADETTLRQVLEAGLRDAFEGIPEPERPTLPANDFYPPATFDHLYYAGLREPVQRTVLPHVSVSDHSPVRAVFPTNAPAPAVP